MRKNKRNLLVAIAAMGLVAAGTGAVSTFAWFTATNNASVSAPDAVTGSMVATTSSASANNFKVTVHQNTSALTTALSGVALTDTSGNTYVDVPNAGGDGFNKVPATAAKYYATVTVSVDITYEGTAASSERDALWDVAIGSNKIYLDVTCTAASGTGAVVGDIRFLPSASAASAGAAENGQKVSLDNTAAKALDLSSNQTDKGTVTFYVAITGHDDAHVDKDTPASFPTYTLSFQPRIAA